MDRGELASWWSRRIAIAKVVIIDRRLAVGAPVPQVIPRLALVDDHTAIPVPVGDVHLVGLGIHPDPRGPTKQIGVVAPRVHVVLTDGHHELAAARELHDPVMPVGADPDVVVVVHEEPVSIPWVLGYVLCGRISPSLHDLPVGVEFDHDGRGYAARPDGRVLHDGRLLGRQRLGKVRDPDVVAGIHEDRRHGSQDPLVGHLPRPGRIDLKRRHPSIGRGGGSPGIPGVRLRAACGHRGRKRQDQRNAQDSSGSRGSRHFSSSVTAPGVAGRATGPTLPRPFLPSSEPPSRRRPRRSSA